MGLREAVETIRRRPGMYIGLPELGGGTVVLLWSPIARAIAHHEHDACHSVEITLEADGTITFEDDGPGIAVTAEGHLLGTEPCLSPGGFLPELAEDPARGLPLFVAVALSKSFRIETVLEGRLRTEVFAGGISTAPVADAGATQKRGSRLRWAPDESLLPGDEIDVTALRRRLRAVACLRPGLTFRLTDRRETVLSSTRGIVDLLPVDHHPSVRLLLASPIVISRRASGLLFEAALQWSSSYVPRVLSLVNFRETPSGGAHVKGLLAGLSALIEPRSRRAPKLLRERLRASIVAALHLSIDEPRFDHVNMAKLTNPSLAPVVAGLVRDALSEYVRDHPAEVGQLIAQLSVP